MTFAPLMSVFMPAETVTFYVVAYVVTTLCAFGVVTILSDKDEDADTMDAYRGLFWRHPGLAVVFTAALFSLAGVPSTSAHCNERSLPTLPGGRARICLSK
jgi:NADH:ubiquinone oxidoreductase subunit 2 (subunit N)